MGGQWLPQVKANCNLKLHSEDERVKQKPSVFVYKRPAYLQTIIWKEHMFTFSWYIKSK